MLVSLEKETNDHYSVTYVGEPANLKHNISKESKTEKLFFGDDALAQALKWIETLRQ